MENGLKCLVALAPSIFKHDAVLLFYFFLISITNFVSFYCQLLNQGVNKLGGNIGYYYSRIAFFQFSRRVYYEYRLSWYQNLSYVQKRILDIPRRPGIQAIISCQKQCSTIKCTFGHGSYALNCRRLRLEQ